MTNNTLGIHCILDLQYDADEHYDGDAVLSLSYKLAEVAIKKTSMKIMSRTFYPLYNPDGGSWFFGLDESHVSFHLYSDTGLIAIDAFTCGGTDPQSIVDYIEHGLKFVFPEMKTTYSTKVLRFHHTK